MFKTLLILWLIASGGTSAISVGVIHHASLIISNPNMTTNGLNCDECLCTMFTSSISSLNCLLNNNNNGVICQFFANEIYLGLKRSPMKINLDSTFYFRLAATQSEITTAHMTSSTPAATSNGITTEAITTMITPTCSSAGRGILASLTSSVPASWTRYSHNYTASSTTLTLIFGFNTEPKRTYYLDDVSVADVDAPNTQLLNNPSFENSRTAINGWTVWCQTSCRGTGVQLDSTNACHSSGGTCLSVNCQGAAAISLVGQSFTTTIGHTYTISYWLIANGGKQPDNYFYADVN